MLLLMVLEPGYSLRSSIKRITKRAKPTNNGDVQLMDPRSFLARFWGPCLNETGEMRLLGLFCSSEAATNSGFGKRKTIISYAALSNASVIHSLEVKWEG